MGISPTCPASVIMGGFTPHYQNGNVLEYVRRTPNADRLNIVFEVACVLAYIHSKGVSAALES
jgi:hypothetical protein